MDIFTKAERSRIMSLIRSQDTKPEIIVRKIAHRMGHRYRLHDKNLPGCPDIIFKSRKKVIFVHGCFWHLHKNCPNSNMPKSRKSYWWPKLKRNAERDKQAKRKLWRMGWKLIVIWECELSNHSLLERRIKKFLS